MDAQNVDAHQRLFFCFPLWLHSSSLSTTQTHSVESHTLLHTGASRSRERGIPLRAERHTAGRERARQEGVGFHTRERARVMYVVTTVTGQRAFPLLEPRWFMVAKAAGVPHGVSRSQIAV